MGSDLKHGFISSLKTAWQTLNEFARAHTSSTQLHEQLAMVASQIKAQEEMQEGESPTMHILLVSLVHCALFNAN